MSSSAKFNIPDRIKSLILVNNLEKHIDEYERQELAEIKPNLILGIGKYYSNKLKRKANIETIAGLANFDPRSAKNIGISQKLLEKWTLSASIIYRYALGTELPLSLHRVCIAGLGAAGKTSLIKTLQRQKSTPVRSPTMGAQIESLKFLGLPITIWDLGGQLGFRKLYLDEPHHYLARIILLIFVIDIQNARLDEAIQYLHDLIIKLKYMKENPKIYLVLHKSDPDIDKNLIDSSSDLILNRFATMLANTGVKSYKVLKTSIYNVENLVQSFSRVFAEISPISEIISDSLAFYSEAHEVRASFIISDNGFITAEWTKRLDDEQRNKLYFEIMEEIRKETYEIDEKRKVISIPSQVEGFHIHINRVEFDSIILFLCLIYTEIQSMHDSKLNELNEEIRPWIKNFFSIINR
ncbi:MAG: ADP-ribosylation factor-like protein [Candidatus Hodarchaeota archaeon]